MLSHPFLFPDVRFCPHPTTVTKVNLLGDCMAPNEHIRALLFAKMPALWWPTQCIQTTEDKRDSHTPEPPGLQFCRRICPSCSRILCTELSTITNDEQFRQRKDKMKRQMHRLRRLHNNTDDLLDIAAVTPGNVFAISFLSQTLISTLLFKSFRNFVDVMHKLIFLLPFVRYQHMQFRKWILTALSVYLHRLICRRSITPSGSNRVRASPFVTAVCSRRAAWRKWNGQIR